MKFAENDIDDQKLIEEINKLDDDVIKEDKNKSKTIIHINRNIFFVTLLILILLIYSIYNLLTTKDDIEKQEWDSSNGIKEGIKYVKEESYNYFLEEDKSYYNEFEKSKENLNSNFYKIDNNLILEILNDNEKPISRINAYIIFYDGENNIIDIKENYVDFINAKSKFYINHIESFSDYERYDVKFVKSYYFVEDEEVKNNEISFSSRITNSKVEIKFQNNSENRIGNVDFQIIYYDNDKEIIDIENVYEFDVKKNETRYLSGYNNNFAYYEVNLVYSK